MGLNLLPWLISAVLALGAVGYVAHCEHVKKDREAFIAKLEQQAKEQDRQNQERAAKEKAAKEQADAETNRNLEQLHRTIERLRNERARASSVPAAPANASRPDLICFDRDEFARAVDNFEGGMESLVAKGAEAAVNLEAARGWALKLSTELGTKP